MTRVGIPSVKGPNGLARSDGKRPDGLTFISWCEGRSAIWDVTVTKRSQPHTFLCHQCAPYHLLKQLPHARAIKTSKYLEFVSFDHRINLTKSARFSELERWISSCTDNPRVTSFLEPSPYICPSPSSILMPIFYITCSASPNLTHHTSRSKPKHIMDFRIFHIIAQFLCSWNPSTESNPRKNYYRFYLL